MPRISRRTALKAGAAASVAAGLPAPAIARGAPEVVVVGAGVFGAWTAHRLQALGRRVTLVDAWGPAHARASSGGESRLTRGSYGAAEVQHSLACDPSH